MAEQPLAFEGTWEEAAARASEFAGRRVRVTVLPRTRRPTGQGSLAEPTIEEQIDAIVRDVPEEAWQLLPSDLSHHLDHYLYGTTKLA